ncbi:hypothetical protein DW996_05585 [Roseburia sp. AM51-8]|nr:hypothetical protein DW996_05585 [Roseburia sp. AM51-8]
MKKCFEGCYNPVKAFFLCMRELCTVVNTEYKKYELWVKDHDQMQTNMDALNSVVSQHTEQIFELQQVCGL